MRAFYAAAAAAILVFAHTTASSEDFTNSVEKIAPSVVTVISTAEPKEEAGRFSSVAGGVVISADGLILTAYHAAVGFDKITVELSDGNTYAAAVRGTDEVKGLALLKIDAAGLTPAEFANSDELRVGQWVLSVGNQFGIEQRSSPGFSVGIIGGLKCTVPYADVYHHNLIKTDAAMNAGCVGGALLDGRGRIVGINIAICSSTGAWQGVGYAIPSNVVMAAVKRLKTGEKIKRGWLGVSIEQHGAVRIACVGAGTPAQKAGLRKGDIILAYNGKEVADAFVLVDLVASTSPGSAAVITIARENEKRDVKVRVGARPMVVPASAPEQSADQSHESAYEKLANALSGDVGRKLGGAGTKVRDAIKQYLADLKDPELIDKCKRALESLPSIELRIMPARDLDQLHEENRDLKRRIEELEKRLLELSTQKH